MESGGLRDLEAPGPRALPPGAPPSPLCGPARWGPLPPAGGRADAEDDRSTRYEPSSGGKSPGDLSAYTPRLRSEDEVSVSSAESGSLSQPLLAAEKPQPAAPASAQGPCRSSLLVVLPAFAAYACLFALQHEVKVVYGIADDDSAASHHFSLTTSLLFAFKLLFRFLHSIVFACWTPRGRLFVGMSLLAVPMVLLAAVTSGALLPEFRYIFIAYALGGAGIGTFEGNVLSAFTFLGTETKKYAVMGMPLGVASITIGAFWLRYVGVPVCIIYGSMALAIAGSAGVLFLAIPAQLCEPALALGRGGMLHQPSVMLGMNSWHHWLPFMASRFAAALADMAILEVFCPGLLLFVYDSPSLSLLLPPVVPSAVQVPKDLFFVLYNLCTAVGGLSSRFLAFRIRKVVHPVWFVGLMLIGAVLVLSSLPGHVLSPLALVLVPFGGFLVLFGDGLVYVMICRAIDDRLPQEARTAAYSSWLFTADLGSNVGANAIAFLRDIVVV